MVILFLIFIGTSILFSIVAAPIYIPNNEGPWGFPFLDILTGFQSQILWGLIFLVQVPQSGEPDTGPLRLWYPYTCRSQCWGVGPSQTMSPPLLPISMWLFLFIFSCGKIFYVNPQVILRDSLPICGCNFGVALGGGKPSIFLLCHLVPPSYKVLIARIDEGITNK